ncbi:MAG: hypothetical protein DBX63_06540 [Clostridia bacterium]|nr:MAG: hypothetical protein DBX63_06540 [Clostridia bacterium]
MGKWLDGARAVRAAMDLAGAQLNDAVALDAMAIYPAWEIGKAYSVDDRVRHGEYLYRVVQAHTSQADWTPDSTPALWVKVSVDEWPEFVQPTGAHDAYNTGDKVTYNGSRYVCTMDANVYAPDVSGWEKQ